MKRIFFVLIFILGLLGSGICNAQDEFRLICYGEISVSEGNQLKTVKPLGQYEIHFKLTDNGLFINYPIIGEIKMSEGRLVERDIKDTMMLYMIKSRDSFFSIGKNKKTSSSYMHKINIMFGKNDDVYHMPNAMVLFYLPNNQKTTADQALHACTINEDMLIKFMKSLF